jgi:ABC-type hemin transport system ATPase subunit
MHQGRLVLLLGPPGSGKTTLLKALSGRLKPSGNLQVGGGGLGVEGKEGGMWRTTHEAAYHSTAVVKGSREQG